MEPGGKNQRPPVWTDKDGRWFYRGLFELLPLDSVADWPVYVSLAEARAYARWQGKRLLSEPEFHRAAFGDPHRDRTSPSLGRDSARRRARQLRLPVLVAHARGRLSGGCERLGCP